MTLHLIKLCVGADSIEDLADWQEKRAAERRKKGGAGDVLHITRMTPKRADELLAGGSLYWVIKGQIAVRQRLMALRTVVRERPSALRLGAGPQIGADRAAHPSRVPRAGAISTRRTRRAISRRATNRKLPDALRAGLTQLGLL